MGVVVVRRYLAVCTTPFPLSTKMTTIGTTDVFLYLVLILDCVGLSAPRNCQLREEPSVGDEGSGSRAK